MTFLNRVVLTGKVITPPQRHYRPDGLAVIQFPIELDDTENHGEPAPSPHRSGQRVRNRINIVAIGKLAEFELDLLQSGQPLMVTGRLHQRRWQTPEGRNRTRTEVIATDFRTIQEKNSTSRQKR